MKTVLFGEITQASFDGALKYLKRIGKRLSQEVNTAITFAVGMTLKHGDATHVNKLIKALAVVNNKGYFITTVHAMGLIPFPFNRKEGEYYGKIDAGRRAALQMEVEKNGVLVPQWEIVLQAAFEGQKPENKTPPAFVLASRMNSIVKQSRSKANATDAELRAAFNAALKEYPEIKKSVPQADEKGNTKLVAANAA
jgi:hypothetical protein